MAHAGAGSQSGIRYQPDDRPPALLAIGVGVQLAILNIAAIMLIPAVVMRTAGASEAYASWAVFATVAVSGLTTVLQAFRFGRFGGGHVLLMGASAAFISVSITAVAEGGPALLATLVIITAVVPLLLSWRLAQVQRIVTPAVAGTVIMLIPITVLPAVGDLLTSVPAGSPAAGAPLSALATVAVITTLTLKAPGAWRLWAPVIGVGAGALVGGWFGLYDSGRVAAAAWVDLPRGRWPGFDLSFGASFWALLPAFLLVAVIAAVRTMSSAVAVQRVSWRGSRAIDYRAVQGAVTLDGVGNLLSGLAGTLPNTTYSVSAPLISLTGVAARGVGIATGAVFLVLVFLPKTLAVILAVPDPVFAGYLLVLLGLLFLVGINIVVQDGLDARKGTIVGLALLIGVSAHYGMIFPDLLAEFAGGLLGNGMNAGGYSAIVMTLFVALTESRRSRFRAARFDRSVLPDVATFIRAFAARNGWDEAMAQRLDAAGEEALLALLRDDAGPREGHGRHLHLAAYREEGGAVLEFAVGPAGHNLQDRIALLGEQTDEAALEREVTLRLLRHLASSVRHRQFHDTDVVTVRVQAPAPTRGART
ncbi:MAG: hypothetical protein OXP69_00310 [Spirochaetaceae bacterium]|nr:hypothetical protein [Spirochaetaceae bacterium]